MLSNKGAKMAKVKNTEVNSELNIDSSLVGDFVVDYYPKTKAEYDAEVASGQGRWWRLYKSGWLEQGGLIAIAEGVITLLKPYKDTTYQILLAYQGSRYDGTVYLYNMSSWNVTTNSFTQRTGSDSKTVRVYRTYGWAEEAFN